MRSVRKVEPDDDSLVDELSPLIQPGELGTPSSSSASKTFKYLSLFAVCCIPFGAHYSKQSLPPLRPFFEAAGTSSYSFGLLLSAAAWPNLLQPFMAGFFVDSKGHEHGAIVFTTLSLIGHAIFTFSLDPKLGLVPSRRNAAVAGRMIFGLGMGGSRIVMGAVIGHHFDSDVTFAIGISQSIHYIANWLGKATPVTIANYFDGQFTVSLWFGCFILLLSCIVAVGYVLGEEITKHYSFARNRSSNSSRRGSVETIESDMIVDVDEKSYARMSASYILALPLSFWAICVLHLLYSNVSYLFAGFSTSYMVDVFDMSAQTAALIASVDALLPVFVSPIVGRLMDKVGGRLMVCSLGAAACCISFIMLLYFPDGIPGGPIIPVVLISVATSPTSTLLKSCVPLLSPKESLGTAFSLYLVFESLGASVGHVGLGYLKDVTMSYHADLLVLLVMSVFALFFTTAVMKYDRDRCDGILNCKLATRL